ncbi:hypothetical protein, partial [Streptomyces sp. JV190]|uniref:hypothetical protein n=1 Tax=Streptomyces sp. JV190 TaxID=3002533 RepID=UPI002E7687C5
MLWWGVGWCGLVFFFFFFVLGGFFFFFFFWVLLWGSGSLFFVCFPRGLFFPPAWRLRTKYPTP